MKHLILLTLFLVSVAHARPSVIPQPLEMTELEGDWTLKKKTVISYADEGAKQTAELMAEQLRPATGYKLKVKAGTKGGIVFQTKADGSLGKEGYELRVSDAVVITAPAPAPAGLFYGAQTLRQLLPPEIYSSEKISANWKVPKVEIRDIPRFGWRGMHLDVDRHFMPKEDVLRFIDTLSTFKFNSFHWHLTEDQGWRIEIKKYPKLTEVGAWRTETLIGHRAKEKRNGMPYAYDGIRHGGFYTQDEVREVVAYAAERHITVVPEIDMPGHMQAAIASYPELGCTTELVEVKRVWGVSEIILNPEESTVRFCKDVLTEVMDLFPSTFIHIGGDEARKPQWEASERIQQLRKDRGLKDMHEMQSWFIKQIDNFLVENNRRLIGWDEIAEGGLAENATIMWWRGHGKKGLAIARNAAEQGHDIVVASTSHLYFDYYQSKDQKSEPLAFGGHLPVEKVYNFEPIIPGLSEKARQHVLGAQGQLWTEYMPHMKQVEYMAFPRVCAVAEVVWRQQGQKNYDSFIERLAVQEKRFDRMNVNYRKLVK
ncbi:beta-N-acetylhexosaminidase [Pontiella sulfatireligans]|uniref:beta-N-acetylhexosaminidase n=1 Tax=Pontiella sulfatireligans TaxID=2750658 RepID=A0A6C2UNE9_9BACT|nr:beta-N-acetylhexosaminidase [Pontiella sulfatireligans]VGO20844.1 Beta-hexosaminidase [Pontiella sulfatireligans]